MLVGSLGVQYFLHTFGMYLHEITLNNGDRTNTFCEGWNSYFNKLVRTIVPNSSFLLVVKCIQQDED